MNSLADAIQPRGCKLGGGEVNVSAPVVSRSKAAHLLDAVEEALQEITLTVAPAAEAESLLSTDLCGGRSAVALFVTIGRALFSVGTMLVNANARAVDHNDVTIVTL